MDEKVYRSYREQRSSTEGFLEDYAFLIQAYISLYQNTFDEAWLTKAEKWMDYTQSHFYDPKEGYFHFSGNKAEKLIARKKEIFDNVIPSSNGVMASNLFHLGIMLDKANDQLQAQKMVSQISEVIVGEPAYMSNWAILYSEITSPMAEIVVVSPKLEVIAKELRKNYLPFSLLMGTKTQSELPLLVEKVNPKGKEATIYVCFNKTCKLPVHTVKQALEQIPKNQRP